MRYSISRPALRAVVALFASLAVAAPVGEALARNKSVKPKIDCSCACRASSQVSVEEVRQTKFTCGGLNGKSCKFNATISGKLEKCVQLLKPEDLVGEPALENEQRPASPKAPRSDRPAERDPG